MRLRDALPKGRTLPDQHWESRHRWMLALLWLNAIDDFGTGYSSLSYLKRFPIDELKIDREFVARLGIVGEDAAIVQAVVALAHALGICVVGEGVETDEQAVALRGLGCERAQGFWLARPSAPENVSALLGRSYAAARPMLTLVGESRPVAAVRPARAVPS